MKRLAIALLSLTLLFTVACGGEEPVDDTDAAAEVESVEEVDDVEVEKEEAAEEEPEEEATVAQKNTLGKAEDYINIMAHSKEGLMEQLRFEGFEEDDIAYAMEHLEVDWNEQAAKNAKQYLDISNYSRSGLIEQLEFEGFTTEQATYGVEQAGL